MKKFKVDKENEFVSFKFASIPVVVLLIINGLFAFLTPVTNYLSLDYSTLDLQFSKSLWTLMMTHGFQGIPLIISLWCPMKSGEVWWKSCFRLEKLTENWTVWLSLYLWKMWRWQIWKLEMFALISQFIGKSHINY